MINLEGFGATLAAGAFVLLGLIVILDVFRIPLTCAIRKPLRDLYEGKRWVLMVVMTFAIGLLAEDCSNLVIDKKPDWLSVLPSEMELRGSVLFEEDDGGWVATPLGGDVAGEDLLAKYGGDEGRSMDELLDRLWQAKRKEAPLYLQPEPIKTLQRSASALYYHAKNSVYTEDAFFGDMQLVQTRVDFARSVFVASFLLALGALAVLATIWTPRLIAEVRNTKHIPIQRYIGELCTAAAFLILGFGALYVFGWEEQEFDKLAYGYFVTMHRSAQPDPDPRSDTGAPFNLGISGMAPISADSVLLVHDTKAGKPEPHLTVMTLRKVAGEEDRVPHYDEVSVAWLRSGDWPSDLEAACALNGLEHQFLVAESGYYPKAGGTKYGRVFHVSLTFTPDVGWRGEVLGTAQLPPGTVDIEGLACILRDDGTYMLIFGERGSSDDRPSAHLQTALWRPGDTTIVFASDTEFSAPDWPEGAKNRDCSDLYLDSKGTLWIASTDDPTDEGPFRSVVYEIGSDLPTDPTQPLRLGEPVARWRLDSVKVEALGPGLVENAELSVGTDDENFGGLWRPLPSPR